MPHTPKLELLNKVDHADLRVITDRGARFGDKVMQVTVFPFEFRNLQDSYPIFFQTDRDGNYYPIALLGFEEGENLFLDEPGWNAPYIPAMLRREPFLVGLKDAQTETGETRQARLLSLDTNHPRVSLEEGEALFQPLGGHTNFLEEQSALLERLHDGLEHCRSFVNALRERSLIEALTLDIELNDGSRNQLIGLSGIDEEGLQQLSGEVLQEWSEKGFLMPVFMILASMSNMRRLIELKNQQVHAEKG